MPDSDIDIRFLVASSAQWRAAMRGWVKMLSVETLGAVGSTQYGVVRPGGAAALRHFAEARVASDPFVAIAVLDVANMHGSMDQKGIEMQVQHRAPRMWALLGPWFRVPRKRICKDSTGALHQINATVGVDQGCPASSTLACLGVVGVHASLGEHADVVGFQDDTYLLFKQDKIKMMPRDWGGEETLPFFSTVLSLDAGCWLAGWLAC